MNKVIHSSFRELISETVEIFLVDHDLLGIKGGVHCLHWVVWG